MVYVSHTINVLVTDIILNITSPEHLTFTYCILVRDYSKYSCKETTSNAFKSFWRSKNREKDRRGTCKVTTSNAFKLLFLRIKLVHEKDRLDPHQPHRTLFIY